MMRIPKSAKNFPEIAYIKITTKCNCNCMYCYDYSFHCKDLRFDDLRKIFDLFHKKGVKGVVITGGEPLLRDDIVEIFKDIKSRGMKVYLDTNGDYFFKYKDEIKKYVDILGLPLDYFSDKVNYRGRENFANVIKILDYCAKAKNRPKIRIGTVVTKENINGLIGIGELLKKYKLDAWKIYQFIPMGINAMRNKGSLMVSDEEFAKAANTVKREYSAYFRVIIAMANQREKAYFFLTPDGKVFMPEYNSVKYKVIGSVFDEGIIGRWENEANKRKYVNNIKVTFGYKFVNI